MTDYRSKHELEAHDAAQRSWQIVRENWDDGSTDSTMVEEPSLPEPAVYVAREIDEPETIETRWGKVLVLPPRVVLTAPDGSVFAISPKELAVDYVEVEAK